MRRTAAGLFVAWGIWLSDKHDESLFQRVKSDNEDAATLVLHGLARQGADLNLSAYAWELHVSLEHCIATARPIELERWRRHIRTALLASTGTLGEGAYRDATLAALAAKEGFTLEESENLVAAYHFAYAYLVAVDVQLALRLRELGRLVRCSSRPHVAKKLTRFVEVD